MIWNLKRSDLNICILIIYGSLRNCPLKHPSIMWGNFLVIIFVNFDFIEAVPLVEFFRVVVGNLNVKVHLVDFGPHMCGGSGQDEFQTL